jgi:hypothetical protein
MSKARKFKIDEWVLYCCFPNSKVVYLREERKHAVVLQVLGSRELYDYEIFIDDGSSIIRKVKEENLFVSERE